MFALRSLVVALAATFASPVSATEYVVPDQHVVGAESPVALGELVSLSVSPFKDKPAGYLSSAYSWTVLSVDAGGLTEKKFREDATGREIFFGSGVTPRKLYVQCVATHLYATKTGDKVSDIAVRTVKLTATVTIGGGEPVPAPIPVPAPTPVPPPPPPPEPDKEPSFADGKYQLSKAAYKWAKDKVTDRTGARALAGSLRDVASRAASLKDASSILKATKASNEAALGDGLKAWDGWFALLQDRLFELSEAGKLETPEDFAAAWAELAAGLDKVK